MFLHIFPSEGLGRYQEWGFKGYVVSDSEAVEFISNKHKVADTYEDGIAQAVNAGPVSYTHLSVTVEP